MTGKVLKHILFTPEQVKCIKLAAMEQGHLTFAGFVRVAALEKLEQKTGVEHDQRGTE